MSVLCVSMPEYRACLWLGDGWRGALLQRFMKMLAASLPLLFAIGFVGPVMAQAMDALGLKPPLGLSSLALGLGLASLWALIAMRTGRWI